MYIYIYIYIYIHTSVNPAFHAGVKWNTVKCIRVKWNRDCGFEQ